jgi:hypothetical protein
LDPNQPDDAVASWLAARGFPVKPGPGLRAPLRSKRPGAEAVISTALFEACADGDLGVCQWLLAHGCRDDARAPSRHLSACSGERPMHAACANGRAQVVLWLCTAAAAADDMEVRSAAGETPLWAAAAGGHLKVVQLLCRRLGQRPHCRTANRRGQTPLHASCAYGHLKVAQWLVQEGGAGNDALRADKYGFGPLAAACGGGHLAVAQWLHGVGGGMGNGEGDGVPAAAVGPGGGGVAPFYAACAAGQLEVARWLWSCAAGDSSDGNGAKQDQASLALLCATHGDDGWTPFTAAVAGGHRHVAAWLLAHGSTAASAEGLLHAPTCLGLTPLYVASFFATRRGSDGGGSARGGWLDLLRWLLQVGAANGPGDAYGDGDCSTGEVGLAESACDGGVDALVLRRDVPYAPLRHALRAKLVASLLEHRAFVQSLLLSGDRGRLRGHEQTLLPLIAAYLGLPTGRQLRNLRQAAALL